MKKIVISWALSFVVMFSLAGLFNSFIIKEFISNNILPEMLRSPPNMLYIAGGYLLLALLMSLLYPKLVSNQSSVIIGGFLFGILISVLWLLPFSLVLHGAYNFPNVALLIDSSWALIEQGLGGVVVAFCYKHFG